MTVNVAIKTNGALVLGCDSIASSTRWMINPRRVDLKAEKDGKFIAKFGEDDLQPVVTDIRDGAIKMFKVQETNPSVGAVTTGTAALNSMSIDNLAHKYIESHNPMTSVEKVAEGFLAFIRSEYDEDQGELEDMYRGELEFLLGGYDMGEPLPTLYKLDVKSNTMKLELEKKPGITWAGQSDYVEAFVNGAKVRHIAMLHKQMNEVIEMRKTSVAESIRTQLDQQGLSNVSLDIDIPPVDVGEIEWWHGLKKIETSYLPTQSAIDLAALLVNIQSGYAAYGPTMATVGGRTRIGVITQNSHFRMIGEPELLHKHARFSSE